MANKEKRLSLESILNEERRVGDRSVLMLDISKTMSSCI